MPNTPNLTLPYPVAADTADVPRDIKALADKLDIVAGGPVVTSLPASPVDGQECYFVADATNGVVWHLKYRAADPSGHKWQVVGGPALNAEITTAENYFSATPGDLPNPGPTLTCPLAGEYDASMYCSFAIPGASTAIVLGVGLLYISGVSTFVIRWMAASNPTTPPESQGLARTRRITIAAGAVCTMKYQGNGTNNMTYASRIITLAPVRVG